MKIKEVCERTGLTERTVRFYMQKGLIAPKGEWRNGREYSEFSETDVEMLAWKTVKGAYPDTEHVKFRTLPEVTVASCTFKGSYAQISDVYAPIGAWLQENGYESDGPMFNIYHVSPHETQNPEEFVTEACYPVKKK